MRSSKYVLFGLIAMGAFLIHSLIWLSFRECSKPNQYRVAAIKGRVVGKDLWLAQYRWLRRMFKGKDATLTLYHVAPAPSYKRDFIRQVAADDAGNFDFGAIEPGDYELLVHLSDSGYPAQQFEFAVELGQYAGPLMVDGSYEGSATCRGRDVEFH